MVSFLQKVIYWIILDTHESLRETTATLWGCVSEISLIQYPKFNNSIIDFFSIFGSELAMSNPSQLKKCLQLPAVFLSYVLQWWELFSAETMVPFIISGFFWTFAKKTQGEKNLKLKLKNSKLKNSLPKTQNSGNFLVI